MDYNALLGILSTAIGTGSFFPYIFDTIKGKIRPHAYSWLVWGFLQAAVFIAQTEKGAGPGSWAIGASSLLCMTIFALSIKRSDRISAIDKASLAAAFAGILLWLVTSASLVEVVIASATDIAGFIPTFAQASSKPEEESVKVFALGALALFISILALKSINPVTVLYPATVCVSNTVFVLFVTLKRNAASKRRKQGAAKS